MPEYSITTTGNFYHSRLEIIFFVIDYDPEIEATFIYWGDGRSSILRLTNLSFDFSSLRCLA